MEEKRCGLGCVLLVVVFCETSLASELLSFNRKAGVSIPSPCSQHVLRQDTLFQIGQWWENGSLSEQLAPSVFKCIHLYM